MESVEDEWERELESEEDLDLLFVTYDPRVVKLNVLEELVRSHQFSVEVKQERKNE